jgi:hypothetical protein
MLGGILKVGRGRFIKLWIVIPFFLLLSCAEEQYSPALDSKGRPYSSHLLVQDLRDRNKASGMPAPYQDNDEEYTYPKFSPPHHRPAPVIPEDNDDGYTPVKPSTGGNSANPYMGDADEDNNTGGYPKYDPEEDNSGYYYMPNVKPLPKPKVDDSGNYTFPIYFD